MRASAILSLLLLGACAQQDRITVVFSEERSKTEAASLQLFVIGQLTDTGEEISCSDLVGEGPREPEDAALQIAQQLEMALPAPAGQESLLVQVPQDSYLFFARAYDRFGFLVARGCQADRVTSQRVLNLSIGLDAIEAPAGRLEPAGATSWLQPTGSPGLEGAPALEVLALDERGQPQAGVEVRVLVESGSALPLEEVFLTSEDEGRGGTVCLVGEGPARVLLHARGLEGSPLAFDLRGLRSPDYAAFDIEVPDFVPVDMIRGDVYGDDLRVDDLGVVLVGPVSGRGHVRYWAGGREGAAGWEVENPELLTWSDSTRWVQPTHAAAGHYDDDCMEATGPCSQLGDLALASVDPADGTPGLYLQHHHTFAGDRLRPAVEEELPPDVVSIERLIALRVNQDDLDDVALIVTTEGATTSARHTILIYSTLRDHSSDSSPDLVLRQQIVIPDPLEEFDPARALAADVDGDGDDELLLAFNLSGLFIVPCFGELGDAATPYAPADGDASSWPQLVTYWGVNLVAAADIDEDGRDDLVLVNTPETMLNEVTVRVAFGTGALETCPVSAPDCGALYFDEPRPLERATIGNIDRVLVADLNGDGHIDLLTAGAERAAMMAGDGSGGFSSPMVIPLNLHRLVAVAATPLDLDAAADLGFLGTNYDGETVFKVRLTGGP